MQSSIFKRLMDWGTVTCFALGASGALAQTPVVCEGGRDVLYFVDNSSSIESTEFAQITNAVATSAATLTSADRVAVVNWALGSNVSGNNEISSTVPLIQTVINWRSPQGLGAFCRSYGTGADCGSSYRASGDNLQDALYVLAHDLFSDTALPTVGIIDTTGNQPRLSDYNLASGRQLVVVVISDAATDCSAGPFQSCVDKPNTNVFTATTSGVLASDFLISNAIRGALDPNVALRGSFANLQDSMNSAKMTIVSVGLEQTAVTPLLSAVSSPLLGAPESASTRRYACSHRFSSATQADKSASTQCSNRAIMATDANPPRLALYRNRIDAGVISNALGAILPFACPALQKTYVANPRLVTPSGNVGTDIGGSITYTLTLQNRDVASTVTIMDTIPRHTTYVPNSASDNGQIRDLAGGNRQVVWANLNIAANTPRSVSFAVTVNSDTPANIPEILNDSYSAVVTVDGIPRQVLGQTVPTPLVRRTGSLTGSPSTTKTFDGQNTTLTRQFQITGGDLVNCTTVPVPAGNPYPRVEVGTTTVEFDCTGIAVRQACTPACFVEVTRRALTGLTVTPLQFFEGEPVAVQVSANNVVNNFPVTFAVRYGPESETCATITNATPPVAPGRYRVCASPITTGPSANYSGTADAILTIAPRVIISPVALANVGSLEGIAFSVTGGAAATSSIVLTLVPPPGACPVNCSVNLAALGPTGPCNANTSGQIICTATQGVPGVSCDRSARRCSIATLPGNGSIPLFVGTRGSAGGSLVGTLVTLAVGASPPSTCRLTATSCDSVATQGEL